MVMKAAGPPSLLAIWKLVLPLATSANPLVAKLLLANWTTQSVMSIVT